MAVYRYQATCVGWWRGKIKRWNTTYHYGSSTFGDQLYNLLQQSGWKNTGDAVGACSGGVASIAVYNSTGGAPISNTIYFDWQTPTSWIPYTGTLWSDVDPLTPLDASGESALVLVGQLPGLSATGKPMSTRKYLHAIPSRTSAAYTDPDVLSATIAKFEGTVWANWMLSPSGIAPVAFTVEPWYGNHQRVRGRRRTVTQVAAQSFSAGVVAGATSGGGSPAQFR